MKIKYAIYRGKVGLYAREYYDKIDPEVFEEMGVLGWRNIREGALPIIVNADGGRCSFLPVADNFIEFREVDKGQDPLTREECFPQNSKEFEYGWISPDGDTFNTGHEGHYRAAEMLCKEYGYKDYYPERELEEKGWVKIGRRAPYTPDNWEKFIYAKDLKITKGQADALVDLGYSSDPEFRFLVEENEGRW